MTLRAARLGEQSTCTRNDPLLVAIYRILYGCLVFIDLLTLKPDWLVWYGTHGFTTLATSLSVHGSHSPSLFLLLRRSDRWIIGLFWFSLLWAAFLIIGLLSRLSSIIVFLCIYSIHMRNPQILNGGDVILRAMGYFLMFAPTGAALSVDRLVRMWRGRESSSGVSRHCWALWLIRFQLAIVYFSTFFWKMKGNAWLDGTALYYTLHTLEFHRFALPYTENVIFLLLTSWATLIFEGVFPILIWFKAFRPTLLIAGLCFHLGIEYSLNIPLFEWIMICTYVVFLDPGDLHDWWKHVQLRIHRDTACYPIILYDQSAWSTKIVLLARALNILDLIVIPEIDTKCTSLVGTLAHNKNVIVVYKSEVYSGREAIVCVSSFIPLLWPVAALHFVFKRMRRLLNRRLRLVH